MATFEKSDFCQKVCYFSRNQIYRAQGLVIFLQMLTKIPIFASVEFGSMLTQIDMFAIYSGRILS